MGIDIDSFIDEIAKEKKSQEETKKTTIEQPKQDKGINLNFEESVKDNLSYLQNESSQIKDLDKLQQIYEEIKQFDESLPNKFLSVEELGNSSLEAVGEKYSKQYLESIQNSTKNIKQTVDSKLQQITQDIFDKDFTRIPQIIRELKQILRTIPEDFDLLFLEIKSKIKQKEIEVSRAVEEFQKNDLQTIRQELHTQIKTLLNNLKSNNKSFIKQQITHIEHTFETIPALFRVTLTHEKQLVDKAVVKAQNFLQEQIQQELTHTQNQITHLEEEFNTAVFNKDLKNALIYYNQIIDYYSSIPNYPVEDKIQYLEKTFSIHQKLHKLYINNNVTLFLETYNYSKTIEQIKDYIEKAKSTPHKIKSNNIKLLEEKINSFPQSFSTQTQQLQEEINNLKILYNKTHQNNEKKQNTNTQKQTNTEYKTKKQTHKTQQNTNNSHNYAIHSKILEEVKHYYTNFKKAPTKQKAKPYYDKIQFYLSFSNLSKEKVQDIKQRLNQELQSKN